ncbi:hypothetical protein ACVNS2_01440 [Paenibacillus caseinilyticus]|uniref:hypothetical protein n=1 Tax=Paenibacillus mucilaginosus TaxID=61624 RepID=UPI000FFE6C8B|nr:hypothetical protein [Paenibacillus mucilaginosus]
MLLKKPGEGASRCVAWGRLRGWAERPARVQPPLRPLRLSAGEAGHAADRTGSNLLSAPAVPLRGRADRLRVSAARSSCCFSPRRSFLLLPRIRFDWFPAV